MGLRNVVVKDKRFDRENELQEIRRKSAGLSTRDAQAIHDAVPGVERVVAKIEVEAWKVLSPGGRAKPRVLGVSSDYPTLVKLTLREGRFFDRTDEDTHAAVCVIGDRVRRDLFGFEPALGRPLKVNDQWLTVVGVLESGGGKREIQGVTLEGTANDIYLPVTAAERRFGRAPLKAPLDELVVSMAPGTPVQESARSCRRCSTAFTAAPPTTRSRCPRRSSSRAAAPSASSTSSWGRSPASRSSWAGSGS